MPGYFDMQEIGLPCAKCGHKTPKTIAWLKSNDEFACAGCGSQIRIDAGDLAELRVRLAELEKKIGDIFPVRGE
jgi:DNA-directed RNA polymerase subunit RPC12/RpoP